MTRLDIDGFLDSDEQRDLTTKAIGLGVHVSAWWGPQPDPEKHEPDRGTYLIRVESDANRRMVHSHTRKAGDVYVLVSECLDHYETEQTWTPEELVTIAAQSGLDVTRA